MEHWSAIGPPPAVNLPRLEQAVVSRTFFDPNELLVATEGDQIVGWIHFIVVDPLATAEVASHPAQRNSADEFWSAADATPTATIASICLSPNANEQVGQSLMTETLTRMRASGISTAEAGLVRDDAAGYAGLEPIGVGYGVPNSDHRSLSLLRDFGFTADRDITRMTANVTNYRPPVSRETLQLRRTSQTHSEPFIPANRRRAAGLSHVDIERFVLAERNGSELAKVEFWFSDAEAEVLSPATSIMDLREAHPRGELSSPESYLIASVLQSLAVRNIQIVETAVDTEKKTLIEQLQKICFEPTESGSFWRMTL